MLVKHNQQPSHTNSSIDIMTLRNNSTQIIADTMTRIRKRNTNKWKQTETRNTKGDTETPSDRITPGDTFTEGDMKHKRRRTERHFTHPSYKWRQRFTERDTKEKRKHWLWHFKRQGHKRRHVHCRRNEAQTETYGMTLHETGSQMGKEVYS
jgi:hypothetical protein